MATLNQEIALNTQFKYFHGSGYRRRKKSQKNVKSKNASSNISIPHLPCINGWDCKIPYCTFIHSKEQENKTGSTINNSEADYQKQELSHTHNTVIPKLSPAHPVPLMSITIYNSSLTHSEKLPANLSKNCHEYLPQVEEKEQQAFANWNDRITTLQQRMYSLIDSLNLNEDNSPEDAKVKTCLNITAGKIDQLYTQLKIYEYVKSKCYLKFIGNDPNLQKQIWREIFRFESGLPIYSKLFDIDQCLSEATRVLIIEGPPGYGKSTQIPQYVMGHPRFSGKRILCTQPNQPAAVSLATRVAFEYNVGIKSSRPGEGGFVDEGETKDGDCRIEFLSEGDLLERIINDCNILQNVGCIIIDEAQQRTINCDILLGCFRKQKKWKRILIIVICSNGNAQQLSALFYGAPGLVMEAMSFPVDIEYKPVKTPRNICNDVVQCAMTLHQDLRNQTGDIVCFLPDLECALKASSAFQTAMSRFKHRDDLLKAVALVLHQEMEAVQLNKVYEKLPSTQRKIVFSSGVSETSITIDGVVYVIDSGIKNDQVIDPIMNVPIIKATKISQDCANVRARICGHTQVGVCYRLYSQNEWENMEMHDSPDIHQRSISLAILRIRGMNIHPSNFSWISTPPEKSLADADIELKYLGALDTQNKLTELGSLILKVEKDPKLVKMIYSGCRKGLGVAAINVASVMSISNIAFRSEDEKETRLKTRPNFMFPEGDIVALYRVFENWMDIAQGKRQYSKRHISKWYQDNYANETAMILAFSTRKMLTKLFSNIEIWKSVQSQDKAPTNIDICRIVCSGYFLHSAFLLQTEKSTDNNKYFHINSETIGNLDGKSALFNSSRPQWIILDKIKMKNSVTTFQITSFIEQKWIQDESPEFFDLCVKKQITVTPPKETIVKYVSQDILQVIFGKCNAKLKSLEKQWKCTIKEDFKAGKLQLQCVPGYKSELEQIINDAIASAVPAFVNYVREEVYLNGTRVIIGKGFQVMDILFHHEYSTLLITNIPKEFTLPNLKTLLAGEGEEMLGALESTEQGNFWNAAAKFCYKKDAKSIFGKLSSNPIILSKKIKIFPQYGPKKQVLHGLSTRLKLSWPVEESTGKANIEFNSGEGANRFIEKIESTEIFPGCRVSRVHGVAENCCNDQDNKILTPLIKLRIPRYFTDLCRFRIDTEKINSEPSREIYIYKLTVADLPLSMDEFEIHENLKQFDVKSVFLIRNKMGGPNENKFQLSSSEKNKKLEPLRKFMRNHTSTDVFLESGRRRTGIFIYFNSNSNSDATDAFRKTDIASFGLEYEQRHRLEIEYAHSVSINTKLMRFLHHELQTFKIEANEKRIFILENYPTGNSNLAHFKCRTNLQSSILWVQEKLEAITGCVQFTDAKIHLLFTWTGKQQMDAVADTGFIHCNYSNRQIWIYGSRELKDEFNMALKNIIGNLSTLEILDKEVELDRKRFYRENVKNQVIEICMKLNVQHYTFSENKLYISGTECSVSRAVTQMSEFTKMFETNSTCEETRECGLCCCAPEEEVIVTTLCQHSFCVECIKPMLFMKPAPPLPISCPSENCGTVMTLNDILKCTPIHTLKSLIEVSVFNYQSVHSKQLQMCPKPDCSQILSYQSKTTGGEFIFCDECVTTYCIPCSKKLDKATKSHDESSCEDVQNGTFLKVSKCVKEIQENILNLKCPRCKMTFLDFDGCIAVTCGCGCGFCGLCLQDCGHDAHTHVAECSKNTEAPNPYVSIDLINSIRKALRKSEVEIYIRNINDPKIRNKVCESIQRDLTDLGIEETFIRSLFVAQGMAGNSGEIEKAAIGGIPRYVREIQDILNFSCPRCNQVLYEFDELATGTCDRCSCIFCILCFSDCGYDDHDAYDHIIICPKNLNRDFHVSRHTIDDIHLSVRKQNVKQYLQNIIDPITQNQVLQVVQRDLVDLGIYYL